MTNFLGSVSGSAPKAPMSPIAGVPGSQPTPPGKQVVLGGNGGLQPQCSTGPALPALLVPEEPQRSRVKATHPVFLVAREPICRVRVLLVGSRHPRASTQGTFHPHLSGWPSLLRSACQGMCSDSSVLPGIPQPCGDSQILPLFPTRGQVSPRWERARPKHCLPHFLAV